MADDMVLQGDPAEARKVLIDQARALDLVIDRRWSVETLAQKVAEAQEAKKLADTEAMRAEPQTPVFLLRDAWPFEDERHNAGETIDVPVSIARRWIECGVARDARPLPSL